MKKKAKKIDWKEVWKGIEYIGRQFGEGCEIRYDGVDLKISGVIRVDVVDDKDPYDVCIMDGTLLMHSFDTKGGCGSVKRLIYEIEAYKERLDRFKIEVSDEQSIA